MDEITKSDIEELVGAMPSAEYFLAFCASLLGSGMSHFKKAIAKEHWDQLLNASRSIKEVLDEIESSNT